MILWDRRADDLKKLKKDHPGACAADDLTTTTADAEVGPPPPIVCYGPFSRPDDES